MLDVETRRIIYWRRTGCKWQYIRIYIYDLLQYILTILLSYPSLQNIACDVIHCIYIYTVFGTACVYNCI